MKPSARVFPKILFVNDYSPDSRTLGDLIRQLLLGYPTDRIAWWYCRRTATYSKPDLHAGSQYYFPLPGRLVPNRRMTGFKRLTLERLWVPLATKHLRHAITAAQPELIWILLAGWPVFAVASAGLQGIRSHVSLWDFPNNQSGLKALGQAGEKRYLNTVFQLIRQADTYDSICPAALEEIQLRTGRKDGVLVHSGLEPRHLRSLEIDGADSPNSDGMVRLAYVGTIISEQGFLAMLTALEKIRRVFPRKIQLEFFGGRNYSSRPWFRQDWMIEHGMFSDEGLVQALRQHSWGIVVMDPLGEDLEYSRFSFPNKIGTYLSAGVPVLGCGHRESSLAQVMRQHHIGRITNAASPAELEQFLAETLRISSPRNVFRAGLLQCAHTEFNAAQMRDRLWQLWQAS